jgi:signal transduction histidine kinase
LSNVLIALVVVLLLGGCALVYLMTRLGRLSRELEEKADKRTRELQAANERLQILDELKSDFVVMASHELRSPLSSMKMGVSTVVRELVGPLNEEQKLMLSIAERNIDRLAKLTTDLLDLTKIEAGQLDLLMEEEDLSEIAREVVEASRPQAKEQGITLEVVSPDGGVHAICDRDRIYQLMQNLVGNALRFTEEGGVTVSLSRTNDHVDVSVADTGSGIEDVAVNTIFEKWSLAHANTRSEKRGAGLGLAICKGIVEAHGGSITARSKQGEGTTFSFSIPTRGSDESKTQDTDC